MPAKRLTVLFTPLDGWGHINACHGLAEAVRDRGHRVVFAIDVAFKGQLKKFGFEEELHEWVRDVKPEVNHKTDFIFKNQEFFKLSPLEVNENICVKAFNMMYEGLRARDVQYKQIIERVGPDIIVIDSYVGSPTLTNSGIPWVWLYSAAPLMAWNSDKLPPAWSGLPLNGEKSVWKEYQSQFEQLYENLHNNVNNWYASVDAPILPSKSAIVLHPRSEYLNIYMYPKELDYKEVQTLPKNWIRVNGFVRKTEEKFEIPKCLRGRPGKLVFLSMGSIGCSHLDLMKRLIRIFTKSKHRFIVSMGPLHDKLTLGHNMWGQAFLAQTAVLPVVDLVITHGGNNTVTETFFYGKPMVVMPLFGDQFENAQRIQETGLGLRLNPFHCSEDELLSSVDRLVNDSKLKEKMRKIGESIRSNNDKQLIVESIEKIVEKNCFNNNNNIIID